MPQAESRPPTEHEQSQLLVQLLGEALADNTIGQAFAQELSQVIDRSSGHDPSMVALGELPLLTCKASGGNLHDAVPVVVAWRLLRLGAKLLDDVEDGDAGSQPAIVINLATGLEFLAQLALAHLETPTLGASQCLRLRAALGRAGLQACAGQHTELNNWSLGARPDPETWLQVATAKSGEPFAWGAWAGALVAGGNAAVLASARQYGYHLGVLLQVADDFLGTFRPSGRSDLAARRMTLPLCYAFAVADAESRARLATLLKGASKGDDTDEAAAQQLLIDLGAQGYLLVVARLHYSQAAKAIGSSPPHRPLVALLDRVMPIKSRGEIVR